ncbi:hypothetical protein ACMYSN_17865 [Klebsiella sp. R445]
MSRLAQRIRKIKNAQAKENERCELVNNSASVLYTSIIDFFKKGNVKIKEGKHGISSIATLHIDDYLFHLSWRFVHDGIIHMSFYCDNAMNRKIFIRLHYFRLIDKWFICNSSIRKYKYLLREAKPETIEKVIADLIREN